jgi:hypothetical protein
MVTFPDPHKDSKNEWQNGTKRMAQPHEFQLAF